MWFTQISVEQQILIHFNSAATITYYYMICKIHGELPALPSAYMERPEHQMNQAGVIFQHVFTEDLKGARRLSEGVADTPVVFLFLR